MQTRPFPSPTGLFTGSIAGVIEMIAASETFRGLVGAASAEEAKASRIHWPVANDRRDDDDQMLCPRPRAIVNPANRRTWDQGGTRSWADNGNCFVSFEFLPSPECLGNREDEMAEFLERTEKIVREVADLAGLDLPDGSATYLNVQRFNLVNGPGECERQNNNDELYYGVTFELSWL